MNCTFMLLNRHLVYCGDQRSHTNQTNQIDFKLHFISFYINCTEQLKMLNMESQFCF